MILAFHEDAVLEVFSSVQQVVIGVDALDVETLQGVFDETGEVYVVEWIRPNERRSFGIVANGEYRLVPTGKKDTHALLRLIRSSVVEPTSAADAVRQIEDRLRSSSDGNLP